MSHATADVSSPPDGALLDAIAREVGTPVYVYDARAIDRAYRALDAALTGCPHAIHYALKANSTLAVVQLLRHLGAGADANSGGEIEVALRAGFIPDQIVFTGVGKTGDELDRAVTLGLKAISAESPGELDRIATRRARDDRARRSAREPDIDAKSHHSRPAFGPTSSACRSIRRGRSTATTPGRTPRAGRHPRHVGSRITDVEPLRRAAERVADLARN